MDWSRACRCSAWTQLLSVMRNFGLAGVLVLAAVVVFAVAMLFMGVVTFHGSGGCNYIPIVNGQPAYKCPGMPH
jgi:hypothetical protein